MVLSDPQPDEGAGATLRLFDLDGEAHTAYGLGGNSALVLVRPDGHIALRAPAERVDLLQQYCQRVTDGAVTGMDVTGPP